jgi:hypothetical protein
MPNQPRKPTPAEVETIRAGHAAGRSTYSIAKELGISRGHISRWSPDLGLTWDRGPQTAAASQARRDRAEEVRSELELDLALEAQRALPAMHEPCDYAFGGKPFQMPKPFPSDQRAFNQIAISSLKASQEIADRRSGNGLADTTSMLARMGIALGVETYVPTDDDGDDDDDGSADVAEAGPVDP